MTFKTSLKVAMATVLTCFSGLPAAVVTLLILMAADMATGLIRAWAEKRMSSYLCRKGVTRKAFMLLVPFVLDWVSRNLGLVVHLPVVGEVTAGIWLVWFYCVSEALSIVENTQAYIPYPQSFKDRLLGIRSTIENPEWRERKDG